MEENTKVKECLDAFLSTDEIVQATAYNLVGDLPEQLYVELFRELSQKSVDRFEIGQRPETGIIEFTETNTDTGNYWRHILRFRLLGLISAATEEQRRFLFNNLPDVKFHRVDCWDTMEMSISGEDVDGENVFKLTILEKGDGWVNTHTTRIFVGSGRPVANAWEEQLVKHDEAARCLVIGAGGILKVI